MELLNPYQILLVDRFVERYLQNRGITYIDNNKLPPGSPMYFYCNLCGIEMQVPENYVTRAKICGACQEFSNEVKGVDPVTLMNGGSVPEAQESYQKRYGGIRQEILV